MAGIALVIVAVAILFVMALLGAAQIYLDLMFDGQGTAAGRKRCVYHGPIVRFTRGP